MSEQQLTQPSPSLPVQSGPQPVIPHTDIPHMGTSQAPVVQPNVAQPNVPQPNAAQPDVAGPSPVQMPPLPTGITQDAINAAITQVQQTGNTDNIPPEILGAACAQLEAQAKAQGIDLNQPIAPQEHAPANHVEAAMLDKKSVMDGFGEQRDSIKGAVAEQREALQQSYKDALSKAADGGGAQALSPESMTELAAALKDLDPNTIALINAMGAMSANPSILSSVIWIEIIRSLRGLIANEAKKQLEDMTSPPAV